MGEQGDSYDNAQRTYEDITSQHDGRYYAGDIYVRNFYMLGKIWEQKGDTAKAIENYEKFLGLWKNADPGVAEVIDARGRLVELTN